MSVVLTPELEVSKYCEYLEGESIDGVGEICSF